MTVSTDCMYETCTRHCCKQTACDQNVICNYTKVLYSLLQVFPVQEGKEHQPVMKSENPQNSSKENHDDGHERKMLIVQIFSC